MSHNFNFGDSSNSPSTPNLKGKGSFFSQAPTTTPAGPPPTWLTNKSTTPAGPPPNASRMFGSSYNASNNTFARKAGGFPSRQAFAVPESSPPREFDDEEDAEGEDDDMDDQYTRQDDQTRNDLFMNSVAASPRGLKRSHNGKVRDHSDSEMSAIARHFATQEGFAGLQAQDSVVLHTEEAVSALDARIRESSRAQRDSLILDGVSQLTKEWRRYTNAKTKSGGLGPSADNSFTRANYVATLLLQLHHPHATQPKISAQSTSRLQRGLASKTQAQTNSIPIPQALLDWLNTYHNPFSDDFNTVHLHKPTPSASESFWDIVYSEMLRGRLPRAVRLLKDAGWESAVTALDDGGDADGYRGKQLENTELVADSCIALLESCPALREGNWDVRGQEWHLFRQRVRQAIADLELFAEGEGDDEGASLQGNVFDLDNRESLRMSRSTRRAESKVPWTIYQNLKVLYRQLLGEPSFILDVCQDWLEASILMTVWWNGDETKIDMNASLGNSLRKSMHVGNREVDVAPLAAYRQRLGMMFDEVLTQEEACFQPDTMDSVQVGIACLMEEDVESVIALLRSWDQSVATAVVEVASLAEWLPLARPSSRGLLQKGFSSEDLMVLSHGPGQQRLQPSGNLDRDETLTVYAELLATRDVFKSDDGTVEKEGWELGMSVLGRLDDTKAAQAKIAELLERINLSNETRLDKILTACGDVGLSDQGRAIAERYADTLGESSQSYGSALIMYARAHATDKIKTTLALLISLCLINSAAMPSEFDLDAQLASLLNNDRAALVGLAHSDPEAAALLSSHLSGYATVRRFYTLRDQNTATQSTDPPTRHLLPLERKREAGSALVAVLSSASDCIRGGLFDPEVESVIPVDAVLALLGETLPLVDQEKRIFTQPQVFTLLRTVEDFDTAPGRIRENAEALLQASVDAYRGHSRNAPSGSGLLRKSKSDISSASGLLGASSYDLLAESVMVSSGESGKSTVNVQRAWDWRKGLDAVLSGPTVTTQDVLMLVRTALAKEVARRWGGMGRWLA